MCKEMNNKNGTCKTSEQGILSSINKNINNDLKNQFTKKTQ